MSGSNFDHIILDEATTFPDFSSKFQSRCQSCNHSQGVHNKIWGCGRPRFNEFDIICHCQEYMPSDNLDYVEWLAEKKGLINS